MKGAITPLLISYHVRILFFVDNFDIVEFDVEILVDGMKLSLESQVVLQLDDDVMSHQGLEEGKEVLHQQQELLSIIEYCTTVSLPF